MGVEKGREREYYPDQMVAEFKRNWERVSYFNGFVWGFVSVLWKSRESWELKYPSYSSFGYGLIMADLCGYCDGRLSYEKKFLSRKKK